MCRTKVRRVFNVFWVLIWNEMYERFPLTTGTPKSKSPSCARLTYFKSFPIVEQPGCSSVNVFVGFSNHKWSTFYKWDSLHKYGHIFNPWLGICLMRADCMHCSASLYIRDLNIRGIWYPWGFLEPIPHGHQGMTVVKFLGSQKLNGFSTEQGVDSLCPMLFKGQLVFCI